MAKARSPEYPVIGLKEAVEKVAAAYSKDYQNKVPRVVLAEHMGYKTLNGKSLGVLSTVGKYGLIEGRGDETRVSDLAVTIIAHPSGSSERIAALREAAAKPGLFGELDERFQGGRVSDTAIRAWLLQQKFIPQAADTALRSYRETKQFVEAESAGYSEAERHEPSRSGESMPSAQPSETRGAASFVPPPEGAKGGAFPQPRIVMNGNRLDIQASVDLPGLKMLQEMLNKYQGILEMMQPDYLK
jgi:hypothetical protein